MSDRYMNAMACGIEPEREGEEPTLEQWRDQCRKLWADRERLHRALSAVMTWHANWDVSFHDEEEWRGDRAIAEAALRGEEHKA